MVLGLAWLINLEDGELIGAGAEGEELEGSGGGADNGGRTSCCRQTVLIFLV